MKALRIGIALWLLCFFQACITIEENYTFKRNGSGTMEYVVDMSAFGEMVESMGDAVGDEPSKLDDLILSDDEKLSVLENPDELESIKGISKVKVVEEAYKSVVSFKFKDIVSLNAAMNIIMPDTTGVIHTFFELDGQVLKRIHNPNTDMNSSLTNGMDSSEEESASELLRSMKYKIRVKGPEMSISGEADDVAITSISEKETLVETNFQILAEDPKALNIDFVFNK